MDILSRVTEPVLQAQQMAAVDHYAIETLGIPGAVLMEQAGLAVARRCREMIAAPDDRPVVVLCGKGNNGGDGFVVARRLSQWGITCEVFLLGEVASLKGDARLNAEIWRNLGNEIHVFQPERAAAVLQQAAIIVDAMLGTGARGSLRGAFQEAARLANAAPAPVLAVDLPTGVDADTGLADPDAVRAQHTVTFGALKPGLLLSPGAEHAGRVEVADIGFPDQAFAAVPGHIFRLRKDTAAALLPERKRTDYKNKVGHVYVVAGSRGMDGAAKLTAEACLRAGAGLVILAAPEQVAARLAGTLVEVMKEHLPEQEDGSMAVQAWPVIEKRFTWADVVAAGPGLGTGPGAEQVIHRLVESFPGTLVLDADGLNLIAKRPELLGARKAPTILTPHAGEFARLSGCTPAELRENRIEAARNFARKYGVLLLLKGAPSLLADAQGRVFFNAAGNPGMATAGMGDVLTGVIAGLAGQSEPLQAAMAGMLLHSLAADLVAGETGMHALMAGDVLNKLGAAFLELQARREAAGGQPGNENG